MLAMSDNSGGVNGGKVKKPRKRYDILKTASCSVCGNSLSLKVNIKILFHVTSFHETNVVCHPGSSQC